MTCPVGSWLGCLVLAGGATLVAQTSASVEQIVAVTAAMPGKGVRLSAEHLDRLDSVLLLLPAERMDDVAAALQDLARAVATRWLEHRSEEHTSELQSP